ncbi:MAG: hypothetical protein ACYTHM_14845 [Planctomycetota bacterium]|jgi:hypothetical protein
MWGQDEADLEDNLGMDSGAAISLDLGLQFPRGPRFRFSILSLSAEGEVPPDQVVWISTVPSPGSEPIFTELNLLVIDLAFCPMVREARWGGISLETGFRYARATTDIYHDEDSQAEGLMLSLGGKLAFPLHKDLLYMDVELKAGLGIDSAFFQFDSGLSLRPTKNFWMRLGYRLLALGLVDRADETDERSMGLAAGGPGLELGLRF